MTHFKDKLTDLQTRWQSFAQAPHGRRILTAARWLFLTTILAYLAYKLAQIGWRNVWQALPTQPLFYLLFALLYVSIPLTEILIYRLTWTFPALTSLPAFFKKRIFNKDVLGYSGEVLFFTWARTHVELPDLKLAETVRDNNILSSAASTTIALVLLGIFLWLGQVQLTDLFGRPDVSWVVGGVVVVALLIPVLVRFRRYIFAMPAATAVVIYGIQCVRMSVGQALQIGLWAAVLPGVPLATWFTYAAVSIMLARVPFVSNKALIFVGIGVELSEALGVSEAAMFGLLGAIAALDKILNFSLFTLITYLERRHARAEVSTYTQLQ